MGAKVFHTVILLVISGEAPQEFVQELYADIEFDGVAGLSEIELLQAGYHDPIAFGAHDASSDRLLDAEEFGRYLQGTLASGLIKGRDHDRNGALSASELQGIGPLRRRISPWAVYELDLDDSGGLDADELVAAEWTALFDRVATSIPEVMFRYCDTSRNDVIDRKELRCLGMFTARRRLIAHYDTSGNGLLEFEEFTVLMTP